MNVCKRIFKCLSNILFVLVILAFVIVTAVMVLSGMNMRQDKLLFGSFGFGHVVTGSMEPDIPTGSFILIEHTDPDSLKIGDVILFRSDDPSVPHNTPVSHAIVRMETDDSGQTKYFTKGTANSSEDTYPVYADDIIGIVTYSSKAIGKVIGLAQTSYIYPILILLLFVSLVQSIFDVIIQAIAVRKDSKHK